MLGNFNRTFKPTEEERREQYEQAVRATAEGIKNKRCWVCGYFFYDTYMPGWIDYRGECSKGNKIDALRPEGEECKLFTPRKSSCFVQELCKRGELSFD